MREGGVSQLRFLKAENVWPCVSEPFRDAVHTHLERIDVPSRYTHTTRTLPSPLGLAPGTVPRWRRKRSMVAQNSVGLPNNPGWDV